MSKQSKRLKNAYKELEPGKIYPVDQAVELVKKLAPTKFDGSVEVHIRLGIDPKKSDQSVRGTVVLPHGTGKTRRVIAFVPAAKEKEAKDAGADIIGDENTINEIKTTQKINFDIAVATPDMMRKLAPVAKILCQKGLMPNPKTKTVTPNFVQTIKDLKSGGKISFKADDTANLHQIIGKVSFDADKLKANFVTFIEAVKKLKPDSMKGTYMKNIILTTSMGPAIKVEG